MGAAGPLEALDLPQEMLEAIGELYRVAGVMFGSMEVRWWVAVVPDGYAGPEIELAVSAGEGRYRRGYRLTITHLLIVNERDRLRSALVARVRYLRARFGEPAG